MNSPASTSRLAVGTLGFQVCASASDFTWILGIETQILTCVWPALYPLSHLPSLKTCSVKGSGSSECVDPFLVCHPASFSKIAQAIPELPKCQL